MGFQKCDIPLGVVKIDFLGLAKFDLITQKSDLIIYSLKQDDLWHSLTEVAHRNKRLKENQTLKDIMDTWTLKMGYPVITVNR